MSAFIASSLSAVASAGSMQPNRQQHTPVRVTLIDTRANNLREFADQRVAPRRP
jgi:hypothetical protein